MELQIYSPRQDDFIKEISWNNEELKQEIAEAVKHYSTMVYTENDIKIAKADRAKLNKFVQALESKRKEIKKQCLEPYEKFEKQIKEITAIVNEPIRLIDAQIKNYDEQKKAEKLEQIKQFYEEQSKPFSIDFEKVYNPKWLNSTVDIYKVHEDIINILFNIEQNYKTIQALPEFSFEASEVFKETLDISKAIQEGQRLADIQKRKAQAEAEREEQAKLQVEQLKQSAIEDEQVVTQAVAISEEKEKTEQTVTAQWVGFKAFLTTDKALLLKEFFNANKIEFKPLQA